jgi:hypothetical protein
MVMKKPVERDPDMRPKQSPMRKENHNPLEPNLSIEWKMACETKMKQLIPILYEMFNGKKT